MSESTVYKILGRIGVLGVLVGIVLACLSFSYHVLEYLYIPEYLLFWGLPLGVFLVLIGFLTAVYFLDEPA